MNTCKLPIIIFATAAAATPATTQNAGSRAAYAQRHIFLQLPLLLLMLCSATYPAAAYVRTPASTTAAAAARPSAVATLPAQCWSFKVIF